MLNFIIAHSGEVHESSIETTVHELAWFVQLPLFIASVAAFAYAVWLISKDYSKTLLITSALLLISGFAFYSLSPLISVLSITVGLVATLLVTLLGLGSQDSGPKKK